MGQAAIRVENVYSCLITDNIDVINTLYKSLRFRARDYFHSPRYKQHLWDGFENFFSKTTGKFLTGLLPEVEYALKFLKQEYIIDDRRKTGAKFSVKKIDKEFLKTWDAGDNPITLIDYQVDFINQIINYKRGTVMSPTGSGKTLILIGAMKALTKNTSILVICNRSDLTDQNYSEIKKWGFENVGRIYGKFCEPNIITCCNVQSLHKIEKLLPKFDAVFVDEIHENMSKVPRKFYSKMTGATVRVAISATPYKFGGLDKPQKYSVKGFFGPIFKTSSSMSEDGSLKTSKLQEEGILSKSKATFYPINEPDLSFCIYQDAVTRGIAENWGFHELVARLAKGLTGRTLILVERLDHGDALKKLIPNALWVQGKDDRDTRREVIKQLRDIGGNVIAIATIGIFNTGLDVKANSLINAASGKAEHTIIQRMGRGLRTASDKEYLDYYDFIFNINEYLLKHSNKRIAILKKEGHEVIVKDRIDF